MAFCISSSSTDQVLASAPWATDLSKASPQRLDLEKVLRDAKSRNRLIITLANKTSDDCRTNVRAMRYCVAADEYVTIKDAVERRQKARKIVGVFVQNGSMFQLTDLDSVLAQEFLKEKFHEVIPQTRELYTKQLAEDATVQRTIKELELV